MGLGLNFQQILLLGNLLPIQWNPGNKNPLVLAFSLTSPRHSRFSCIDHSILLWKLSRYGLEGHTLDWAASYLGGRILKLKVNGSISLANNISTGVPQGSIWGPVFFAVFVNDISSLRNQLPISLSYCMLMMQPVLSIIMTYQNPYALANQPWNYVPPVP